MVHPRLHTPFHSRILLTPVRAWLDPLFRDDSIERREYRSKFREGYAKEKKQKKQQHENIRACLFPSLCYCVNYNIYFIQSRFTNRVNMTVCFSVDKSLVVFLSFLQYSFKKHRKSVLSLWGFLSKRQARSPEYLNEESFKCYTMIAIPCYNL